MQYSNHFGDTCRRMIESLRQLPVGRGSRRAAIMVAVAVTRALAILSGQWGGGHRCQRHPRGVPGRSRARPPPAAPGATSTSATRTPSELEAASWMGGMGSRANTMLPTLELAQATRSGLPTGPIPLALSPLRARRRGPLTGRSLITKTDASKIKLLLSPSASLMLDTPAWFTTGPRPPHPGRPVRNRLALERIVMVSGDCPGTVPALGGWSPVDEHEE
jgi:hypothetical protein